MNTTARIALASTAPKGGYTCSEERRDDQDIWVIRDRRGRRLAELFNVRDAYRMLDTLNNDTTNGWN